MSISSCPRCAEQVRLPAGISDQAQVRCPHCKSQYTLAEALVNAPPLLEVVEESELDGGLAAGAPAAAWHDEAPAATTEPLAEAELDMAASLGEPSLGDASIDEQAGQDMDLVAESAELDDLTAAEHDTEVEDLFRASEPSADETPAEAEPLDVAGPDEMALDFGAPWKCQPRPCSKSRHPPAPPAAEGEEAEMELDFGEALSSEPAPADETLDLGAPESGEASFDFDETVAEEGGEASIDFGESVVEEEAALDFGASESSAGEAEEPVEFGAFDEAGGDGDGGLDFGSPSEHMIPAGNLEGEEIVPDFGEPLAAPAAEGAVDETAEPSPAKKGKEKKKKEKKVKEKKAAEPSGDQPPRKRSLVGLLASVVLPGIVVIPFVLYGALWIDPAYDLLGVGNYLPSAMLPASMKKSKQIAHMPITQPQPQSIAAQENPVGGPAGTASPSEPAAPETTAPEAANTRTAGQPSRAAGRQPACSRRSGSSGRNARVAPGRPGC